MLKKRIIPCLDIRNGQVVKGINFKNIAEVGDPVTLARNYCAQDADELVFLDITASSEKRKTLLSLVERIAEAINIPFTVGGGISTVADAGLLLRAGADKVSVNSSAVKNPHLLTDISAQYGSQCVVLAIDALMSSTGWKVTTHGGKVTTTLDAPSWAQCGVALGAGEILLTSMQQDGVRTGFDIPLIRAIERKVNVPIIASGGAGDCRHFKDVFKHAKADAALAASIFHYGDISIPKLKNYLKEEKIPVR